MAFTPIRDIITPNDVTVPNSFSNHPPNSLHPRSSDQEKRNANAEQEYRKERSQEEMQWRSRKYGAITLDVGQELNVMLS